MQLFRSQLSYVYKYLAHEIVFKAIKETYYI